MGEEFGYRSADGSNNSYIFPKLGAANTPYARSVRPITVQPGAYPDPGLIFDSILARDVFKPNPNKVSSIFFNWASLVIHDLFQTDHVSTSHQCRAFLTSIGRSSHIENILLSGSFHSVW
jgi:linoleate 10R-lipoxygenase